MSAVGRSASPVGKLDPRCGTCRTSAPGRARSNAWINTPATDRRSSISLAGSDARQAGVRLINASAIAMS